MSKTNVAGYAWVVLGTMILIYVVLGMALSEIVGFLPYYSRDLGFNFIQGGILLTISLIPLMFVGPLSHMLSPKLGSSPYKKMVVISLAIATVAMFLTPFAPEFWSMLALRFFIGIGFAWVFVIGAHITAPWFGFSNAAKLGMIGIGALVAGFLVPLCFFSSINAVVFNLKYNNTIMYVMAPLLLISTILAAILIKEVKHK